jgi:hypothetical protein
MPKLPKYLRDSRGRFCSAAIFLNDVLPQSRRRPETKKYFSELLTEKYNLQKDENNLFYKPMELKGLVKNYLAGEHFENIESLYNGIKNIASGYPYWELTSYIKENLIKNINLIYNEKQIYYGKDKDNAILKSQQIVRRLNNLLDGIRNQTTPKSEATYCVFFVVEKGDSMEIHIMESPNIKVSAYTYI